MEFHREKTKGINIESNKIKSPRKGGEHHSSDRMIQIPQVLQPNLKNAENVQVTSN